MALPMQPVEMASDGVVRFKKNRIVDDLLDFARERGFGLNEIALGDYTDDEHMQLAQLIGYSVSGYGGLSYVSSKSYKKAAKKADKIK